VEVRGVNIPFRGREGWCDLQSAILSNRELERLTRRVITAGIIEMIGPERDIRRRMMTQ